MVRRAASLGLLVASTWCVSGDAQAQSSRTGPEVVQVCRTIAGCIPESTSLLLVYVHDIAGDPIPGMAVTGESVDRSAPPVTVQTDRHGMVAISTQPQKGYRIRITEPGWPPLTSEPIASDKGGVQVLRVVMRLPPIF
jgi:hypothetical protein